MAERIKGMQRLRRKLKRMPDTITAGVKGEVKDGANVLLSQMGSDAPHQSITDAMSAQFSRDGLTAKVGLIGKRAARKGFLAFVFQFGAKAHQIRAGTRARRGKVKKVLRASDTGEFIGREVSHPGMAARPFFFDAMKRNGPQIIRKIKAAISRAIDEAGR